MSNHRGVVWSDGLSCCILLAILSCRRTPGMTLYACLSSHNPTDPVALLLTVPMGVFPGILHWGCFRHLQMPGNNGVPICVLSSNYQHGRFCTEQDRGNAISLIVRVKQEKWADTSNRLTERVKQNHLVEAHNRHTCGAHSLWSGTIVHSWGISTSFPCVRRTGRHGHMAFLFVRSNRAKRW